MIRKRATALRPQPVGAWEAWDLLRSHARSACGDNSGQVEWTETGSILTLPGLDPYELGWFAYASSTPAYGRRILAISTPADREELLSDARLLAEGVLTKCIDPLITVAKRCPGVCDERDHWKGAGSPEIAEAMRVADALYRLFRTGHIIRRRDLRSIRISGFPTPLFGGVPTEAHPSRALVLQSGPTVYLYLPVRDKALRVSEIVGRFVERTLEAGEPAIEDPADQAVWERLASINITAPDLTGKGVKE